MNQTINNQTWQSQDIKILKKNILFPIRYFFEDRRRWALKERLASWCRTSSPTAKSAGTHLDSQKPPSQHHENKAGAAEICAWTRIKIRQKTTRLNKIGSITDQFLQIVMQTSNMGLEQWDGMGLVQLIRTMNYWKTSFWKSRKKHEDRSKIQIRWNKTKLVLRRERDSGVSQGVKTKKGRGCSAGSLGWWVKGSFGSFFDLMRI